MPGPEPESNRLPAVQILDKVMKCRCRPPLQVFLSLYSSLNKPSNLLVRRGKMYPRLMHMTRAWIEQASCSKPGWWTTSYGMQVQTTATSLVIPPTNSVWVASNLEMRSKKKFSKTWCIWPEPELNRLPAAINSSQRLAIKCRCRPPPWVFLSL
jgi:hypothetical protein